MYKYGSLFKNIPHSQPDINVSSLLHHFAHSLLVAAVNESMDSNIVHRSLIASLLLFSLMSRCYCHKVSGPHGQTRPGITVPEQVSPIQLIKRPIKGWQIEERFIETGCAWGGKAPVE